MWDTVIFQNFGDVPVTDLEATISTSKTQLIDRAVLVLRHLDKIGQRGALASEIASAIGLSKSTAHRIIQSLERHRLVDRDQTSKRYRLGIFLFALGARAADITAFRRICRPALLRIAAETGDTAMLFARSGFNSVCIDRQEGTYVVDSLTGRQVGGELPLGVGPAAQLMLAYMPPEEAREIVKANESLYPGFNDLSGSEILGRLPMLRRQGYAVERDRFVEGLSAVAMPIKPWKRDVICCATINVTTARMSAQREEQLLRLLRREIEDVEAAIL